jgi:hypothetical protein
VNTDEMRRLEGAGWLRPTEAARLREALEKGRIFERRYQESLGAAWTRQQQEVLDSVQSAFIDAYVDVLGVSE